jgi:hypothetical protein
LGLYRRSAFVDRGLDDGALPGDTLVHFGEEPISLRKMSQFWSRWVLQLARLRIVSHAFSGH